ncbi:MAG: MotA/TolQ/ExbB proton channel family protein, partial [Gammaproteobacteria bacterium]
MKRMRILFAGVVALQFMVSGVYAAATLDELLQKTKELRAAEQKLAVEREASFKKELDRQERAQREAVATRNAEEARSNSLSAQFDANEVRIRDLKTLLRQQEGNLGELFGVTRQVAGDAAGVLQDSLITTQFPAEAGQDDREAFLRRLAAAKVLPSIRELERLWFELQREMTETGKVTRFSAGIVQADGKSAVANVVRVGPFTAVTEGTYLSYLPGDKSLARLPRQPSSEFLRVARSLGQSTGGGYVPAVVDPSRGALLSLYVERPDVWERVQKGELVGYIIISVGILGVVLWAFQLVYLIVVRLAMSWQLRHLDRPARNNPLGRVLSAATANSKHLEDEHPEVVELRISEAVLREVPKIERFQGFLR